MAHKLTTGLILASAIIIMVAAQGAHAVSLIIGGKPVLAEPAPALVDSTVFVPISVLDAVGAKVNVSDQLDRESRRLRITPARGSQFTHDARLINGKPMVSIREIGSKLGVMVDWDGISRTLSIQATVSGIEFDGKELKVSLSYPVAYDVAWWQKEHKLILDLHGVYMPSPSDLTIRNATTVPIRTGQRECGQIGRIVLDMPGSVEHKVNSPARTSDISITLSAKGGTLTANMTRPADSPALTAEPPAVITDIRHEANSKDRVEVRISADKPLGYTTHLLRQPDRLVVDFSNASLGRQFDNTLLNAGILQGIRVTQRESRTVRMTLHLTRVVGFDVKQDESRGGLIVGLNLPKSAGGLLSQKTVVIDPGHGGKFPGAPGCIHKPEAYFTLEIGKRLQSLLAEEGAVALMTRESDIELDADRRKDLLKRVEFARRHSADLFISIHCNAMDGRTSGTETFYRNGSISGKALAECIHAELTKATGLPDRGIKPDPGWVVLQHDIPGVLLEVGFLDHPHDAAQIAMPAFQQRVAEAVVRGLRTYVEGNPALASTHRTEVVEVDPPTKPTPVEPTPVKQEPAKPPVQETPVKEPPPVAKPEPVQPKPQPAEPPVTRPGPEKQETTPGPHRPGRRPR